MHLVFLTRGHIREVEEYIKFLQTIPFNFPIKNEVDGSIQNTTLWAGVRPIQLWEIVFPEKTNLNGIETDSLDFLMNTLSLSKEHSQDMNRPFLNKYAWLLRKMLKLHPIPDIKPTLKYPFPLKYVQTIPIGWKEDEYGKLNETPNISHEKI